MSEHQHLPGDTDECPFNRGEFVPCLNCGRRWGQHSNWSCSDSRGFHYNPHGNYYKCLPSQRYLTPDMVQDKLEKEKVGDKKKEVDDWRGWRHNRPGDCVCGIVKAQCDYHR